MDRFRKLLREGCEEDCLCPLCGTIIFSEESATLADVWSPGENEFPKERWVHKWCVEGDGE